MTTPSDSAPSSVLSVSQLTLRIKELLETSLGAVWVRGEISNVARPRSGHIYLTLKDERAQISAVIWRGLAGRLRFDLQDGMEALCGGEINVYPPHGKYQLVIRQIEPCGEGALQLALKRLHQRLSAEGLFAPEHKKPLPPFPRRVAFVTSPTGAAIRDFLEVARRRWRNIEILVIPVRVQGDGAAGEIAAGVELANRLPNPPEVLVVGRGGGSLEDLWCFNEEAVVRAVFASRIPVVSAVGHEIDVTLSDLAADVRALTPSEAAERITPSMDEALETLARLENRLAVALRTNLAEAQNRLEAVRRRPGFRRPFARVQELARRLDELDGRISRSVRQRLFEAQRRSEALAGRLESLSPLAVFSRGYSMTMQDDGRLLRDAAEVEPGQQIVTQLSRGRLASRVEAVDREANPEAIVNPGSSGTAP